jgi:glycosyltransferase involved in cell wall biosynthesis
MNLLTITDSGLVDIAAYQALHTAAQFQKWGHTVSLMCPAESRLCRESPKYDLAAKELNFQRRMGFFDGARYDIIHYYDPGPAGIMLLKKMSASSKIFISRTAIGSPEMMLGLKDMEPYVTRFIASCPSVQRNFCAAGINPARTFIVPPGINTDRWESAMLIRPAMFQKRPFKVGTVSMDKTLAEQEFFLKTAKMVLAVLPETNFLVVSFKDERIRAMARRLGISHKVDVLWEREDMPEVMAMLHIFVKAAARPCMSMSLIEAQASGVPCVIPRVRGLSDSIMPGRSGILVKPGDIKSFAAGIIGLIKDPALCHTISKTAYDQVHFNMSMPVVTNLIRSLYEDALAR